MKESGQCPCCIAHLSYIRGCALLTTTRNASPVGLQLSDSTGWPSEGVKSLQAHSSQTGPQHAARQNCLAGRKLGVTILGGHQCQQHGHNKQASIHRIKKWL